jgi:hypothetical protein
VPTWLRTDRHRDDDHGGRQALPFESAGDGRTRVTESYEVRWIPEWVRILDVPLNRHKELFEGMRTTLERVKTTSELARRNMPVQNELDKETQVVITCFTSVP